MAISSRLRRILGAVVNDPVALGELVAILEAEAPEPPVIPDPVPPPKILGTDGQIQVTEDQAANTVTIRLPHAPTVGSGWGVAGRQVVGAQRAAIPSAGDADVKDRLNDVIATLRGHGLIAASAEEEPARARRH